jgi:hypothetical protein
MTMRVNAYPTNGFAGLGSQGRSVVVSAFAAIPAVNSFDAPVCPKPELTPQSLPDRAVRLPGQCRLLPVAFSFDGLARLACDSPHLFSCVYLCAIAAAALLPCS